MDNGVNEQRDTDQPKAPVGGDAGAPEPGEQPDDQHPNSVEHVLGMALFRINRAMIFGGKPVPELNALPMAQLRLLWTVQHMANATMKDYSERLDISQSTVTQLADHLVRRDFIARLPDPVDRRVVRLALTPRAAAILGKADEDRRTTTLAVWHRLEEMEQQLVMQALRLLGDAAEKVRMEQGNPLPPMPDFRASEVKGEGDSSDAQQPVVDIMARRVRGQQ